MMMSSSTREEDFLDEMSSLRRTMRDLVALSALPAIWTGYRSERIAESLADIMLRILSLEFIYIRLPREGATGVMEVVRCSQIHDNVENRHAIGRAVAPWLSDPFASIAVIPHPLQEGTLRIASARFGSVGDAGIMVAGSLGSDFPSAQERLLISVGTNQAAMAIQREHLARLYAELLQENSDRRRAEEALRASEQRLQDIIDHTTAVIFVKDLELRYLLVNREFERLHRVRRDEIRGKSDFDIHSGEVAEAVRANDRRVIEAGEPSQFEEVVPTADGKRVYLAVKFLLGDRAGKPYAVCGIATDITERKRAEELEAQMAHERAMFLEEKTRLAGEIHDSLAQSFTGITMQLEMAKEIMTDKDNDLLSYVERANDLARFGLAEARRSVLSLQPMIIKDASLIESLQMLVERSNIPGRLRCTFCSNLERDESLPVVVRQDLLRIAQEAISNALRHAKSTAISVSLHSDPSNLILKVKDNGRGITTEAEAREGFGFVNMRARVKKLNGSLDIRTASGRGTSIVVRVPLNARS
jgi:PAS domain S-box-containing protein